MRSADWSLAFGSDLVPGPYSLRVCLVNLHMHSQFFEFRYDPYIEPYCDGNRRGYRIMPPADHHHCEKDERFWIILSRNCGNNCLSLHHSTEYTSEAAAIAAAEQAARACPDKVFFTMEAVAKAKMVSVITERLRRC